ncbi:MAG: phospho-N-acetylmuramoyl-pentapeptide-transferase [Buchnera aphidicola (Nurudea yanoniella)]
MIFLIYEHIFCTCVNTTSHLIHRSVISLFTSFIFSLSLGSFLINFLKKNKIYQIIRKDGPKTHHRKKYVPTMGGILILSSIIFSVFLWTDLSNLYIWHSLFVLIGFGIIGLIDDYKKIFYKTSIGLSYKWKFIFLSIVSIISIILILYTIPHNYTIPLTFLHKKTILINIGITYIFLLYFILVGSSNAVNLTDGLDGLAIVPIIFITSGLYSLSVISSNINYSQYFNIAYIQNIHELAILCTAIIGSGLGFLWFNTYPAKIFMGDVGSLALGGTLGIIAILLHQEILFFIMSGIFVLETLSVIIQVIYFKLKREKIFKMTPIHHHYELIGCPEPRLIVRLWIISFIFTIIGLVFIFKAN